MSATAWPRDTRRPPLPGGLLVATLLVGLQVSVRAGFLLISILRAPHLLNEPAYLLPGVIIPCAMLLITVAMIVLVFARATAAKPFGITVCVLNLLYLGYAIVSYGMVSFASRVPAVPLSFRLQFALTLLFYLTVFVLELIFLIAWDRDCDRLAAETRRAEQMAPPAAGSRSYFARHWRGELSLPRSYWINGVLIFGLGCNLIFVVVFMAAVAVVRTNAGLAIIFLLFDQAFDIAAYVWAVVGNWRSANNYKGPRFWAVLAKIGVSLGVLITIAHVMHNLNIIARISSAMR